MHFICTTIKLHIRKGLQAIYLVNWSSLFSMCCGADPPIRACEVVNSGTPARAAIVCAASSNWEWLEGEETGSVMEEVDLGTLEPEASGWKLTVHLHLLSTCIKSMLLDYLLWTQVQINYVLLLHKQGEDRLMFCTAFMFCTACSTKHQPIQVNGGQQKIFTFLNKSFHSAWSDWFLTNYKVRSDSYFL